jgi:hypothetical protein
MSSEPHKLICRYCKNEGHFKRDCPKLIAKNKTQPTERHNTHKRLLRADKVPETKQKFVNKPVEIVEPIIDEFPSLSGNQPQIKSWGSNKSFIDVLKTEKTKTDTDTSNIDEVQYEILGKIHS